MDFNYAREYKLFEEKWERLRAEYRKAGMSEEVIEEMYKFDRAFFNSSRSFRNHQTDSLDNMSDCSAKASMDELSPHHSKYWWIDEIDNPLIAAYIRKLPKKDIELLTLYVFEDFQQKEIAEIMGVSPSAINQRLSRIKKIIKNIKNYLI